ncbi:MAG: hypothetical protein MUF15_00730 [Acidobacteria bacterium]|jgi:hypothetical protein|nr:hypothetical protein [Acidobacteriota bacterium]
MIKNSNNDTNNLIIFPAFEVGYSELLHFLKSMENSSLLNKLLLICPADFFNAHPIQVPYHIPDDFKSHTNLVQNIATWLKSNGFNLSGIISVDEEEQFNLSKRIAQHFNLPFYRDHTCATAANKYLLKTAFKKHGVPTGNFIFFSGLNEPGIEGVGFPNVLKVLSGNGSQYLFRSENRKQLEENFHILKTAVSEIKDDPRFREQEVIIDGQTITLNPRQQFLLEAFSPGEEFSCDFVVQDNAVQVVRVVRKVKGPYFGYFKGYHLLAATELDAYNIDISRLKELCERIAAVFDITAGVCMVDFKMQGREWNVLEASIRPGLSAFNHLMYEIYGYTSLFLMAKLQLHIPINIYFPRENGAVVYLYGRPGTKIHKNDTGIVLERLRQEFQVLHVHTYEEEIEPGAADSLTDHSALLRGYVILKNIDGEKLPGLADRVNEVFYNQKLIV